MFSWPFANIFCGSSCSQVTNVFSFARIPVIWYNDGKVCIPLTVIMFTVCTCVAIYNGDYSNRAHIIFYVQISPLEIMEQSLKEVSSIKHDKHVVINLLILEPNGGGDGGGSGGAIGGAVAAVVIIAIIIVVVVIVVLVYRRRKTTKFTAVATTSSR